MMIFKYPRITADDDTKPSVKCCVCDEWGPEDEAIEFKGEWFDRYCAENGGLRMCAWCGKWEDISDVVIRDGDWFHPACANQGK